jgi:hypothetical protein
MKWLANQKFPNVVLAKSACGKFECTPHAWCMDTRSGMDGIQHLGGANFTSLSAGRQLANSDGPVGTC